MKKTFKLMQQSDLEPWLVGRSVVRSGTGSNDMTELSDRPIGRVVGYDRNDVMVSWSVGVLPEKHRTGSLWLLDNHPIDKTIGWNGNTFGELDMFVQQAKREGVQPSALLNKNQQKTHVHIDVSLPLATEPETDDGPESW